MNKILSLIMALAVTFTLTACGTLTENEESSQPSGDNTVSEDVNNEPGQSDEMAQSQAVEKQETEEQAKHILGKQQ